MNKIKIWTGVGACVLVSAAPALAEAVHVSAGAHSVQAIEQSAPANWLAQGGEGGEGGEGGTGGFQDQMAAPELVDALRDGGYVIFFRHTQTEVDFADQVFARMGHCATQRMLSEEGWQQARAIGQAFEALEIPVGNVFSSEYCRAWQTADLAFGRYEKVPGLNFAPSEEYTPEQVSQMRDGIMPLLIAVPARGTNTVIVGHDDVFEAATGIYPEPQGVAFILRPDGQGEFEVIANLTVTEWVNLAR